VKLDSTVTKIKSARGRTVGYSAHFRSIGTAKEHLTKDAATADLEKLITFRCDYESVEVKIASVRGHVGAFSYNLFGDIASRHVWPDGTVSLSLANGTLADAESNFRYHVAQITWDGTLANSDILTEAQQQEFRRWCEFQLRYKYAHETLGLKDGDAHQYACDGRNPYQHVEPPVLAVAVESQSLQSRAGRKDQDVGIPIR
jgi:hypothetical protein